MNVVILTGRLGKDPEERYTRNGRTVSSFNIAVDRLVKRDDEWEREAEWFQLTAFGGRAEYINEWIAKGDLVEIRGSLSPNVWEDDNGTTHYGMNIIVHEVTRLAKNNGNGNSSRKRKKTNDDDIYDDYESEDDDDYGF